MRRTGTICVATLLLLFVVIGNLMAMDGQEVISKYLEARGGKAKLEAIKTMHMVGTMSAGGMNGKIETWHKTPMKYAAHMTIQMQKIEEGCDGEHVWQVTPMGLNELKGDDRAKRLEQVRIEPMLGFTDRGGKLEYVGLEPVKGVDCHKVRVIQATGDTTVSYFDAGTFLLVQTEVDTPQGKVKQSFDDYKAVDGIKTPQKMSVVTPVSRMMITMDSVEINQPVADSIFVMPKAEEVPTVMKPVPDSLRGKSPDKDK